MSLIFWRGRIVRAIAGDLSADKERKMRAHLVRCEPCRTYYDLVSTTAEGLGRNRTNARRRERQRLVGMLDDSSTLDGSRPIGSKLASAPTRRRWGLVIAPTLALAGLALWIGQRSQFSSEPIAESPGAYQWRGTQDKPAERASSFRVLIHARKKSIDGGATPAIRMVAEFPGSGEGRVSLDEFVQFSYRGLRAPSFLVVAGLQGNGTLVPIIPGKGLVSVRIESTDHITSLGPSLDLRGWIPSGSMHLVAVISENELQDSQIRGTIAAWQRKASPSAGIEIVSGLLIVEP